MIPPNCSVQAKREYNRFLRYTFGMKLILINGQPGAGKSAVADALKNELLNSAYIDADSLVSVNPFDLEKLDELMLQNATTLINNFDKTGYEVVIAAGLTRSQALLNKLLEKLDEKISIHFVWLRADKEARMNRKMERSRDGADSQEHFDFVDQLYPDVQSFEARNERCLEIDTSSVSVRTIVEKIKSKI